MSALSRSGSRQHLTRPTTSTRLHTPTPPTTAPAHRPPPATPTDTADPTEPVLYTAEQAAVLLQIRPSWLRRKAAARAVPCRYVGKHLRFTRADIHAIAENSAHPPWARRHISGS